MDAESVKQLLGNAGETSGVPVEHMDYDYISKSSSDRELENILKALRSGTEGHYPDLIRHCEERIGELNPKSKALRKDKRPATEFDLGKDEWQHVNSDLKSFLDDAHVKDEEIKQDNDSDDRESMPIRGTVTMDTSGQRDSTSSQPDLKPPENRIKSSDYQSWEKYDVEKETERVDESDDQKNTRLQAQNLKSTRSSGVQEKLKTEGCTAKELEMLANREKDKGNEAFRAGDFAEAILYYTRSLSVIPSAPAYNNRALARIRLEQFPSAVGDCNKVLELEPDNLKAMLRRGTARKSLHQYEEACKDLEYVLSVEPGNKQAKDLLKDVKTKMNNKSSTIQNGLGDGAPKKGKRMVIEEVDGSNSSEGEDSTDGNISCRRKSPEGSDKSQVNGEPLNENSTMEAEGGRNPHPSPSEESNGSNETQSPKMTTEAVQTSAMEETPKEECTPVVKEPPPAKPLPVKVVKLIDGGTEQYKAGQYGIAKEKYSTALKILEEDKPSYLAVIASLYSNRAACQLKMGECQGCITDCDTVLEMTPYNIKLYLRRGSAFETLERYNYAYSDYQQAMTLDPYNSAAQVGATRSMKVLKEQHGSDWRETLPSRNLVVAPGPKQPQPVFTNGPTPPDETDAVMEAAPTREKSVPKDNKGTSEKQDKAIPRREEKSPERTEERFQKLKSEGNDFVKKGKYEDAIKCYTACTEIDPSHTVPFTNRALCYLKLNQNKEAEEDCTKALELDPQNIKGYYRRALARKGLEVYFESVKDLTALLKLEPTNASAKKELEIVKDFWRKELREKQQPTANHPNVNNTAESTKKKNILIEEADTDSEDEKVTKQNDAPTAKPGGKKGTSSDKEKESKEEKHGKHQNNRTESKSSDKHKNSRSKSKKEEKDSRNSKAQQSVQAPKLNKVTAYEFMQAWMSLKSTKDSLPYAQLLRQVPPDHLPAVLSNKLDAPMLTKILKAVEHHLVISDPEKSYKLLSNLCRAQRFQTVLLFMTNEEKQGIDKCLASLAAKETSFYSKDDIEKLRKSFGLINN